MINAGMATLRHLPREVVDRPALRVLTWEDCAPNYDRTSLLDRSIRCPPGQHALANLQVLGLEAQQTQCAPMATTTSKDGDGPGKMNRATAPTHCVEAVGFSVQV